MAPNKSTSKRPSRLGCILFLLLGGLLNCSNDDHFSVESHPSGSLQWTHSRSRHAGIPLVGAPWDADKNDAPIFAASPNQIHIDGATTLFWRIPGCDRIQVIQKSNGLIFDQHGSCSYFFSVSLPSDDVFTLRSWNNQGQEFFTSSAHVTTIKPQLPPPEINQFSVVPDTISEGQSVTVSWDVSQAIRLEFVGEGGRLMDISPTQFAGQVNLSPKVSTTYVVNAYSLDGTLISSRAEVRVATPRYPPRIEQWTAANTNLSWGESTVLTWRVSNDAVKIEMIDPQFGTWPLTGAAGSVRVTPNTTSPYILNAYGEDGLSSSQVLTLNVIERVPEIQAFTVSNPDILAGQKTTLSWNVQFASRISLASSSGEQWESLPATGNIEVSPQNTTTFQLNAFGRFGNPVRREALVQVTTPERQPTISFFTSSNYQLVEGETAYLGWRASDCSKVIIRGSTIANGAAEMGCEGSLIVGPLAPETTYFLTALSNQGQLRTEAQVSIRVLPRPLNPVIVSFYSTPVAVFPGQGATIIWQVNDCERVYVAGLGMYGGEYPCIGSQTVYPYGTSEYRITAVGRNGSLTATQTITVAVTQPPSPPNPPPYPGPYPRPSPYPYPRPHRW